MISGNPYKFAVLSGVINEWNLDDTFGNGVLLICINGDIYPKEIVTATLRCEIEYLRQGWCGNCPLVHYRPLFNDYPSGKRIEIF